MFHDYTVIRVYGCEEKPYKLPVTPRIFALEVLRQRLHSDELHFSSKKQTTNLKFPITIGTFTVRNKATIQLIDDIMVLFRFSTDEACQYDPLQIISKKKKRQKRGGYDHKGTLEMT